MPYPSNTLYPSLAVLPGGESDAIVTTPLRARRLALAPSVAQAGVPFEAWANGLPADRVGSVAVGVRTPAGATVIEPSAMIVTEPARGQYRAALSVPTAGMYAVRWTLDGEHADAPVAVTDITPPLSDVGALMYDRLIREGGAAAPTFDTTTTPSATQVDVIVRMAVADLVARVGRGVPAHLVMQGRYLAALRAAVLIEQAYAPEQTDNSASYDALVSVFDATFPAFATRCRVPVRVPVA